MAEATTPKAKPEEVRYILSYEVDAHGEKIKELVFREPTVSDIINFGDPLDLALRVNLPVLVDILCALASVPPSTIRQLKPRDLKAIQLAVVARFFYPPDMVEPKAAKE